MQPEWTKRGIKWMHAFSLAGTSSCIDSLLVRANTISANGHDLLHQTISTLLLGFILAMTGTMDKSGGLNGDLF